MIDFAVIGAPKSGTSSFFYWLDSHPGITGSTPKETFFLMDEGHPLEGRHGASFNRDGPAAYERFFQSADLECLRFEGTTHYFYQATARQILTQMKPQPRIMMLLREPAERILSSFRFTRDNLCNCDKGLTFNQYVEALLSDSMDDLKPYYWSDSSFYVACRELKMGQYVDWLEWWLERLSYNHLGLIVFERLKQDPVCVMREVCNSLRIDGSFYDEVDFRAKNKTTPIRFQLTHRLARKWGAAFPSGSLKSYAKNKYLKWQGGGAASDSEYEWGLSVLREYYAPYNHRLEQRFDLELGQWWGGDATTPRAGDRGLEKVPKGG